MLIYNNIIIVIYLIVIIYLCILDYICIIYIPVHYISIKYCYKICHSMNPENYRA